MRVDLYHDTVCPWCRIGKRHLALALEQWAGEPVEVHYHTFFLNPDIPPEGFDFRAYMRAKGGGQVPLEGWFDAPRRMGAAVGLTFNFERIERAPNSLLSHRLIALTPPDQQIAMIDALYAAYFEHGRDIGELDTLIEIAREVGLDGEATRARLLTDEASDAVLADAQAGARIGVTGVPFFVLNQRYAFSGAQPPEVILDVLRQVAAQSVAE
jgi:predicted DsbA family dithiol-disulfide isomerase